MAGAERYQAALDGIELDCETIDDGFEKSIARYEYPYVDGVDTEDMGFNGRTIRIRCYFLLENYPLHVKLVEHLKGRELFELSHPKYGIIKVRVERCSVRHDERLETAEVDLDCLEHANVTISSAAFDVLGQSTDHFVAGQDGLLQNYAGQAGLALGPGAETILAQVLDPDLSLLEQITGVTSQARGYLKAVDGWVGMMDATLAAVANPANSLLAIINYPNTLPGRVIGALARTIERYALLRTSFKNAPGRYLSSLRGGLSLLSQAVAAFDPPHTYRSAPPSFSRPVMIAAAQRVALETAEIYQTDQTSRQQLRRLEGRRSFDPLGNYLHPEPAPSVMTVGELEETLALARTDLQAAIDQIRADNDTAPSAAISANNQTVATLKASAQSLLTHVNEVKLERDRLVLVSLDNPMPLHLVCLRHNLSYQYAERLLAVNRIKHPNFTDGEVLVYV